MFCSSPKESIVTKAEHLVLRLILPHSLHQTASGALYHTLDKVYLTYSPKVQAAYSRNRQYYRAEENKKNIWDEDYVAWHFLKKEKG